MSARGFGFCTCSALQGASLGSVPSCRVQCSSANVSLPPFLPVNSFDGQKAAPFWQRDKCSLNLFPPLLRGLCVWLVRMLHLADVHRCQGDTDLLPSPLLPPTLGGECQGSATATLRTLDVTGPPHQLSVTSTGLPGDWAHIVRSQCVERT